MYQYDDIHPLLEGRVLLSKKVKDLRINFVILVEHGR